DMDAIGADLERDIDAIVDDERHAGRPQQRLDAPPLRESGRSRALLGAYLARDIAAIVVDERHAGRRQQRLDAPRLREEERPRRLLVAQLDDRDAAGERRPRRRPASTRAAAYH